MKTCWRTCKHLTSLVLIPMGNLLKKCECETKCPPQPKPCPECPKPKPDPKPCPTCPDADPCPTCPTCPPPNAIADVCYQYGFSSYQCAAAVTNAFAEAHGGDTWCASCPTCPTCPACDSCCGSRPPTPGPPDPRPPAPAPETAQFNNAFLQATNAERARTTTGAEPLRWSDTLAAKAQSWSEHLASTVHNMQHETDLSTKGYGQNLFVISGGSSARPINAVLGTNAADSFNSEAPSYYAALDRAGNDQDKWAVEEANTWHQWGHYSQQVWYDTKQVGCGAARDTLDPSTVFVTCDYLPYGNFNLNELDNVKAMVGTARQS